MTNTYASLIHLQDEGEHDDDKQGERKDDLSSLINGQVAFIPLKKSIFQVKAFPFVFTFMFSIETSAKLNDRQASKCFTMIVTSALYSWTKGLTW